MKQTFIENVKKGSAISDTFLVIKKDLNLTKAGKPYLNITLADKSGEIEARVWDNADDYNEFFEKGDIINVSAQVNEFKDVLQFNVNDLKKAKKDEVDLKDYLKATPFDVKEMFESLLSHLNNVENPYIKTLLLNIVNDNAIGGRFKEAPAAMNMHHAYIGGLLEHVLSLLNLIDNICNHYKNVNKDLLVAGAILHDIGKIYEYSYDSAIDFTIEGRLVGHISIETQLLHDFVSNIKGFPERLELHIKHIILSHHGKLEFGSPKRPKTMEAVVFSYLDDLDAKVFAMETLINDNKDKEFVKHFMFDNRYMFAENLTNEFLNEENIDREKVKKEQALNKEEKKETKKKTNKEDDSELSLF